MSQKLIDYRARRQEAIVAGGPQIIRASDRAIVKRARCPEYVHTVGVYVTNRDPLRPRAGNHFFPDPVVFGELNFKVGPFSVLENFVQLNTIGGGQGAGVIRRDLWTEEEGEIICKLRNVIAHRPTGMQAHEVLVDFHADIRRMQVPMVRGSGEWDSL